MTTSMVTIKVDAFINSEQIVINKEDSTYRFIAKECKLAVEAILITNARNQGLYFMRDCKLRNGTVCKEKVAIQKHTHIAKYFSQLNVDDLQDETKLKAYQQILYDVAMAFTDMTGWELTLEKELMARTGYVYEAADMRVLKKRKGDVAKILTQKHRDALKDIIRPIRAVLGAGYFDITQKKNGEEDVDEEQKKKKKKVAGQFSILKNAYVTKEVCNIWEIFIVIINAFVY
jgi:hypothetical protein